MLHNYVTNFLVALATDRVFVGELGYVCGGWFGAVGAALSVRRVGCCRLLPCGTWRVGGTAPPRAMYRSKRVCTHRSRCRCVHTQV